MPSINRTKASKSQLETLVSFSERKNTNKEHFDLITAIPMITKNDASFKIEKIANKPTLPMEIYNFNKKISEDPNVFLDQMDKNQQIYDQVIDWKIEKFKKHVTANEWADATIIYIDISSYHKFEQEIKLSEEQLKLIKLHKQKADTWINSMTIVKATKTLER